MKRSANLSDFGSCKPTRVAYFLVSTSISLGLILCFLVLMNSGDPLFTSGRLANQACSIRAISWSKKSYLLLRFAVGLRTRDISCRSRSPKSKLQSSPSLMPVLKRRAKNALSRAMQYGIDEHGCLVCIYELPRFRAIVLILLEIPSSEWYDGICRHQVLINHKCIKCR